MADIIPLKKRELKSPTELPAKSETWVGDAAVCMACQHRWAAVAQMPLPKPGLECPNCHCFKGCLERFVEYHQDVLVYTCQHCAGSLFGFYLRDNDPTPVSACATCGNVGDLLSVFDSAKR